MALIQTVHLSMANFKSAPVVPAVQNDTDRQVKMILDDYTLTSGLTGKIAFERSDGTHYETAAELVLADNAFVADIDQALTQPGRTMVQLKVTDTLTVSSFSFVIFVEADNSGTVTPQEGIDLVTAVEAAEAAADRAESAASSLELDDTLTSATKAAQAKAAGDAIGDLKSVITNTEEKTYNELFVTGSALTVTQTIDGYGLLSNGRRAENDSYAIDIYGLELNDLTDGDLLRLLISADTAGVYQFMTTGGIPVNYDPTNLVGPTVTVAVDGIVAIPTTAKYLVVSRNANRTDNIIAKTASRIDGIEADIDDLQEIGDNFKTHLLGENLVNADELEAGYYYLNGVKSASANMTSAWLDVNGISVINASGRKLSDNTWSGAEMYYICSYDENKNYIANSMDNTGPRQYTVPAGAKYLTVSYVNITYKEFTVIPGTKRPVRYVNSIERRFILPEHTVKWYGKKWSAMGDSLTEYNFRAEKNYIEYIAEKTGIMPNNLGVSGTGYRRGVSSSPANSFYNRVSTIPSDCDVLTIFGSFNDIGGGQTLGTIDDDISDDTVFGYVNATLDAIYTAIPTINIGIIAPTPWKDNRPWDETETGSRYVSGLKQICYNRGIPFLDLYHCSNLRPWDATARDLFYSNDVTGGVNAGCHPDSAGHAMIAPKIEAFLDSLLLD